MDVVIIDTAAAPCTPRTSMAELAKVRRVIERQLPGAPHESADRGCHHRPDGLLARHNVRAVAALTGSC